MEDPAHSDGQMQAEMPRETPDKPHTTTAWVGEDPPTGLTLDILQRLATALARTDEPLMRDGPDLPFLPGMEPVGEVPKHLRHAHNLLDELSNEADELTRALAKKQGEMKHIRDLFFSALGSHITEPKNTEHLAIHKDWSVTAKVRQEGSEDSDLFAGFGEGPGILDLGAMLGGDDDPLAGLFRGMRMGRRQRMRPDD